LASTHSYRAAIFAESGYLATHWVSNLVIQGRNRPQDNSGDIKQVFDKRMTTTTDDTVYIHKPFKDVIVRRVIL